MAVPYVKKSQKLLAEKYQVAAVVWSKFIVTAENPRLLIDAGSSAEMVARVIRENLERTQESSEQPVIPTVFTQNLAAWEHLRKVEKMDLYLMGGRYTSELNAIIEPAMFDTHLKMWNPNMTIIAVSGIDSHGLYCSNKQDETPVKEKLAQKPVEKRIVVCDHSKIGINDVRQFISVEALRDDCEEVYLITNAFDYLSLKPEYRQKEFKRTLEIFQEKHGDASVIQVNVPEETRIRFSREESAGIAKSPDIDHNLETTVFRHNGRIS